ncbi:3-phosphoshikimate 1-carboxyvinyltransferase [soil metagenome]
MPEIHARKAKPIAAEIRVPGDKSISHRSILFSALSNGRCEVTGFLPSDDCLCTVEAMRALGTTINFLNDEKTALEVIGNSLRLTRPEFPIDCGNSGTTMRLLAGILAGQDFPSQLFGDESLSRRPMGRIIDPLNAMGATIKAEGDRTCSPLTIHGSRLRAITYEMPMASAQVKSAILLAGLLADGKTTVIQPATTRDHTERMLHHLLVKTVQVGNAISIYGGQIPEARDIQVPGDISSAAFWIVAAAAQPGAELHVTDVGLNSTRAGILKVLLRMGAKINDAASSGEEGPEPAGTVTVRGCKLKGTTIGGDEIANVIDELPILAVAGALAEGETVIKDAAELRVKESDRIARVAENLRAMGVQVDEFEDGMRIQGGARLRGIRVDPDGDHRLAMAFAVAGLFADGETVIENTGCVNSSYPGFDLTLKQFMSHKISLGLETRVVSTAPDRAAP